MEPKEILKMVAAGQVSMEEVRKAKSLVGTYWDKPTEMGYLGFNDSRVIQASREKFDLTMAIGRIMTETIFHCDSISGLQAAVKVADRIRKHNENHSSLV